MEKSVQKPRRETPEAQCIWTTSLGLWFRHYRTRMEKTVDVNSNWVVQDFRY